MEKKLPKVFANKIEKPIGNNDKVFYSAEKEYQDRNASPIEGKNVLQKISSIFNSKNYIYKADVLITLKDRKVHKRVVGKSSTHLITLENELIAISDVLDIEYDKKM